MMTCQVKGSEQWLDHGRLEEAAVPVVIAGHHDGGIDVDPDAVGATWGTIQVLHVAVAVHGMGERGAGWGHVHIACGGAGDHCAQREPSFGHVHQRYKSSPG